MGNNNFIDFIIADKKKKVSDLIELINTTTDHDLRSKLIFTLIDNFKDERIIPTLIDLIERADLKHYNASYIFACNEYSPIESKAYLNLFVDITINGDYEASMTAAQLILDFPEPYEWEVELLDDIEQKLCVALNSENKNKEFIKAVFQLFEQ